MNLRLLLCMERTQFDLANVTDSFFTKDDQPIIGQNNFLDMNIVNRPYKYNCQKPACLLRSCCLYPNALNKENILSPVLPVV